MNWLRRLTDYAAHRDSRAATGNTIALVLAGNGPFYPLYGAALIGWATWPLLLTMAASPLFAAVPWVMRRDARAGRALLVLLGTLNTLWCVKLLGGDTGVDLFLLPCAMLAALLFRRDEWWLALPLLALPIAGFILTAQVTGAGQVAGVALLPFSAADAAGMMSLNRASVAMLTGFLGLTFSRAA